MKRTASNATQARLQRVLSQVGADGMQPVPGILATPWAKAVNSASRVTVLFGLKSASFGTPGFDYGPVGLTLLRWITVNRLARLRNPEVVWHQALATDGAFVPSDAAPGPRPTPTLQQQVADVLAGQQTTPVTIVPTPTGITAVPVQPIVPTPVGGAAPTIGTAILSDADPVWSEPASVTGAEPAAVPAEASAALSPAEAKHPEWTWVKASKVFGMKGLRGNVAVWPKHGEAGAHPRTPSVDAGFVWTREHLQWAVFAASESPAKGVWLWGNRGAGKTEFARQFAAMTGRPFFGVTFSKTMEPMDFIGSDGAQGGNSVWRDGTILQGLRCSVPAVIMFDEMSYGQSSHVAGPLNEIVHPACSFNVPSTGERVNFSDGHLFIAADNTNGTGDSTGMYVGANPVNRATMDRFAYFRRFTYLPKALEVRLLMNRSACDEATASRVWNILDALRKKVDSGLLNDPPSTREAIAFCCALRAGFDEKDAFETSFVGKYAEESQEEMRVTFVASFAATPAP